MRRLSWRKQDYGRGDIFKVNSIRTGTTVADGYVMRAWKMEKVWPVKQEHNCNE